MATYIPAEHDTGMEEACRRIAAAARSRAKVLDLGGLGLRRVPEELYAAPALYDLTCVEHLYLGAPQALQEVPYWRRRNEDKKKCNAVSALAPALFNSLPRLKSLHLDQNRIAVLPQEIAGLTSLDLSNNRLGADSAQALAALTGLTWLDLSHNDIGADGARTLATLTGLTSLDLSNNRLGADGARVLAALTGLTSLDLSNNRIGADGARALATLTGLTSLDLSNNHIGADGARALAALTGLTSLDLSNNRLGADSAQALAAFTGLTSLDLSNNFIGDDGARALTALTGLTSLDLSNNDIGADGARALAALTGLTSLDLSNNAFDLSSNRIGADGARALAALTGLTSLDLSNNDIGDDGAWALASLTGLTSLRLANNRIGADGARALAALTELALLDLSAAPLNFIKLDLPDNPLALSLNRIGADGARALAALTGLTSLDLSNNCIGDDGAQALTTLTGLTWLNLTNNRIGTDGAWALAALPGLTTLNLSSNNIGADGARALAALTGLIWLDLSHNGIGDDGAADLSPLMNLTRLQALRLSGSCLGKPLAPLWKLPALSRLNLKDAILEGVPAEVLSDHCLESLRAHFVDLEAGRSDVTDIKLMILGNGRVGKTQICRRLRGQPFDPSIESTHGVQVSDAPLPVGEDAPAELRIWDFGGQDIYHGTHALFLKSRAIFPLVWTPDAEAQEFHEYDGFTFRNQPLAYWLAYAREGAGPNSPVLVIQSQCDEPEQELLQPPVPNDMLSGLPFRKVLHYSAKTDRGRGALNDALADAVRWLRKKRGVDKIGAGRAKVKAQLEAMLKAGTQLLPMSEYLALCERTGGVRSPEHLLDYLHNCGAVFYRKGLFDNAIILDQAWALEAVYAALDRKSKAFKLIEAERGRFRRSDLEALVWRGRSQVEQRLFLSFMEQCGICFTIREGDVERGIEPIFVAPDLLPQRKESEVERALRERWDGGDVAAEETLTYELLPPGLMRTVIARIGEKAGAAGEYWRDGFYIYDEETGSRALAEQRRADGWAGTIHVQTKGGQAEALLNELIRLIDDRHILIGARPGERIRKRRGHAAMELDLQAEPAIKPCREPATSEEWAISYAWGDDTSDEGQKREADVDKFCAAAEERGITLIRDKTALRFGGLISPFMQRIGASSRVFIFLSDKYLKSAFCMYELFEVWRNCRQEDAAFIDRTRVWLLPCARISQFKDRLVYTTHWEDRFNEMNKAVKKHGPNVLGIRDHADFRRMQDFASKTPDMLRLVLDVLRPNEFEDFLNYSFD
jgi:internalin A